jgi:hypothetical protein
MAHSERHSAENHLYEDLIYTSDDSNDDASAYAFDPDDLDDLRHASRFKTYTGLVVFWRSHEMRSGRTRRGNWASLPEDERFRRWI